MAYDEALHIELGTDVVKHFEAPLAPMDSIERAEVAAGAARAATRANMGVLSVRETSKHEQA